MDEAELILLGERLRVYSSSATEAEFLYDEIFRRECYGDVVLAEDAFVVDVGANIGMFLLYVYRRCPGATALAFEPVAQSAQLLRRNIGLHQLHGVELHEVALGASARTDVPFTVYPMIPGNSTRYPRIKESQKETLAKSYPPDVVERTHQGEEILVQVRRLSDFLPAGRTVDLLKVDVEGAEVDVLRGIAADQWPLITQVVMEVQDNDDRLAAACEVLRTHGLAPRVQAAPVADGDDHTYMVTARHHSDRR